MKTSIHSFIPLCLMWLFIGGSYMDLDFESASDISPKDDEVSLIRDGEDFSYYYFNQIIYISERQDLLFVKISDEREKELLLGQINNGASVLKLYNYETGINSIVDTFLLQSSNPDGILVF